MKIFGISHPIPTKYAERIYNENKTLYIGKSYRGKVTKGDKFIIYESYGAKAYTGWADIVDIGKMTPNEIFNKYKNKMMVSEEEFKDYAKGTKQINYIEFQNFEKFKIPVKPKKYITKGGKYIDKKELEFIIAKKG